LSLQIYIIASNRMLSARLPIILIIVFSVTVGAPLRGQRCVGLCCRSELGSQPRRRQVWDREGIGGIGVSGTINTFFIPLPNFHPSSLASFIYVVLSHLLFHLLLCLRLYIIFVLIIVRALPFPRLSDATDSHAHKFTTERSLVLT
jgi:hypothetical protein